MKLLLVIALICVAFSFASAQTISSLIQSNGNLTFLSGNLTASAPSLSTLLNSAGNYTFFAPNNIGFNNLPALNNTGLYPNLNTTLYYHTASGAYPLTNLPTTSTVASLAGYSLTLNNYTAAGSPFNPVITVNGAVIQSFQNATNGFLSVIQTVLFPPMGNALSTIQRLSGYSEAYNFFSRANATVLAQINSATSTLFVPNNAAFVALNNTLISTYGTNLTSLNATVVNAIVLNHLLNYSFPVFAASLPSSISNAASAYQAAALNINSASGVVTVTSIGNRNTGTVQNVDLVTSTGVIFTVNTVLMPGGIFNIPTPVPTTTGGTTGTTTGGATTGATTGTTSGASIVQIPVLVFALIALLLSFF